MIVFIHTPNGWEKAEQMELFRGGVPMKTCVTCAHWQPDKPISGLIRSGGKCPYKGDVKIYDSCWFWKQYSPEQEESRRKAGLV